MSDRLTYTTISRTITLEVNEDRSEVAVFLGLNDDKMDYEKLVAFNIKEVRNLVKE